MDLERNQKGNRIMPFYNYRCPECEKEVEFKHPISESPTFYCTFCHMLNKKIKMVKLMANYTFKFLGKLAK